MAINFPNSPTNNQEFTVDGTVYRYNATKGKWTAVKDLVINDINEEKLIAFTTVLGTW